MHQTAKLVQTYLEQQVALQPRISSLELKNKELEGLLVRYKREVAELRHEIQAMSNMDAGF